MASFVGSMRSFSPRENVRESAASSEGTTPRDAPVVVGEWLDRKDRIPVILRNLSLHDTFKYRGSSNEIMAARPEEKRGERREILSRLRQEVTRKIAFLEHKAVIDYREVYHLVRGFFKEYLERRYEFTINELREEISKTYVHATVRDDIKELLKVLERMEYTQTSFGKDELVLVLERFKRVVEHLVRAEQRSTGSWARIRRFLLKEEEEPITISELPAIESADGLHIHLRVLLERTYAFLDDGHLHKAATQYKELLALYETCPEDIKQEFYELLDETYQRLVEASDGK